MIDYLDASALVKMKARNRVSLSIPLTVSAK